MVYKLLIGAALAVAIAFLLKEPGHVTFDDKVYDLAPAVAPRLAGPALQFAAKLLRMPLVGSLLLSLLYKENHFYILRKFVGEHPEIPTYYPISFPSAAVRAEHVAMANESADVTTLGTTGGGPGGHHYASAQEYIAAYKSGVTTPLEVAERVLAAVAHSNQHFSLRAFVHINGEDLLRQGREATQRYREGRELGPLDGVPIAVKEELNVLGYNTTLGTNFLGTETATDDHLAVARLRAKGALVIGGVNMHEIGIGTTGHNIHYGHARNPHNPDHHTGGSSSGSAAAVAAGLVPIAIGADGGGSIRLPSSLCGVYGLKPSFGRVPSLGKMAWSVGHTGPHSSRVSDLALSYLAIAGPHPDDPNSQHQPPPHIHSFDKTVDLSDLRIGVYWPWVNDANWEVVAQYNKTLASLVGKGAKVVPITIPYLNVFSKALTMTISAEMAIFMDKYHEQECLGMAPDTQIILMVARIYSALDFLAAQQVRTRSLKELARVFHDVDVILTPATPITAPLIAEDSLIAGESNITMTTTLMRYMFLANLAGIPGVTVPVGYDTQGLPIAVQVMGPHWHEHVLLRIAHTLESFVELRRPIASYSPLTKEE